MRVNKEMKKGISLIVLILTIVIILILSTVIIMGVINNNPISNAKEATLRNDLQVMKEAYGLRTGELILKYKGDKGKITVEDYEDVVNEKYKGEVKVCEEGLAYLGKDKKKQKVAEEMGYIIGNPNDAVLRAWTSDSQDDFHAEECRTKITKITFITNNKVPDGVIKSWDVSAGNNGGVMAWIVSNGEDGYELTIGGNTKIIANTDSSNMFYNFILVKEINIKELDTSKVKKMISMFDGCECLTSVDLSNFNTSKVTTTHGMFHECNSLISLDVSNFDTSQVTDMYRMFYGCNSLINLNLNNFNTSNVTNMKDMFRECSGLTNLYISSFDTNKVTTMAGMFAGCNNLTNLDLSKFDTNKVINMESMFYRCSGLTNLDVSNFDTSKVINMSYMFLGCSRLISLDLSKFDTNEVKNMRRDVLLVWQFNKHRCK